MSAIPESLNALLAVWNEKDPERIRGHLEKALAPDIVFADPNYCIEGIDAFEDMVREFLATNPDATCEHTSGFNMHHNRYRYEWLVSIGGKPAVPGMDVALLNEDGKVARIDGFFGPVPPA